MKPYGLPNNLGSHAISRGRRTSGAKAIHAAAQEGTAYVDRYVHRINRESEGKNSGIPHLAKNERDARISCTRHQEKATCAAFIEESRMKFINANKLHRKFEMWGTSHS
jgi:hypothetical protein